MRCVQYNMEKVRTGVICIPLCIIHVLFLMNQREKKVCTDGQYSEGKKQIQLNLPMWSPLLSSHL
jgi:hypothetical protein